MAAPNYTRICTSELKSRIERKLGREKTGKYFDLLRRYLRLEVEKQNFDRICIEIIGRENVRLHNQLLLAVIRNAQLGKTPPLKQSNVEKSSYEKAANGSSSSDADSLCQYIPSYPHKGRTPNLRQCKFRVRPSPLGPHGKSAGATSEDPAVETPEQQSATEIHSFGSRPPGSEEDEGEVEQVAGSPSIRSRSPVKAPFGINIHTKGTGKVPVKRSASACSSDTCHNSGVLPETGSLMKRLEEKVEMEGLRISADYANLLNNSLDVFLKRLIKPCVELASSRSQQVFLGHGDHHMRSGLNRAQAARYLQRPSRTNSASMLDFRVAMEMNPQYLGQDWPTQLEKINICASEE